MISEPQKSSVNQKRSVPEIHVAWVSLIRHCQTMGHGELERIKIQDGIPVLIEKSVERIKLT